ncbi:hypothetical protein S40288_08208 [Stachybotrys chartarum IBT 40288]|nr:hypothetical protein S40288_08208 [Stachybotrys chartarum IBT 40288]
MKSFGLIGLVLCVRDEVIVEAGGDCAPPRVRVDTDGLYQIFAMCMIGEASDATADSGEDRADFKGEKNCQLKHDSFPSEPFPLYDDTKFVVYRSEDGRVVMGMLREKGKDTLVWPVDEFLFTGGSIKIDIHGGENFTLSKANLMVMRMGQTIPFECSDNFTKVAVLLDGEDKVTLV